MSQLLNLALAKEPLRDELYCQLVKQFSDNRKAESVQRVWQMMLLALSTFPPSEALENYLEMFLRCVCVCVRHDDVR